jgi:hypothetical protein
MQVNPVSGNRKLSIVRALGWLAALALAFFVAIWTYVISNEVSAPNRLQALGLSLSGRAEANYAYATFSMRQEKDETVRVSDTERRLAAQAYRREPLSVPAVALLAKSMMATDATKEASLFNLAGKLSRRNMLVNSELIKSSASQNDAPAFFIWLSRAMLTNDNARDVYGMAMADATARDGAVEALVPVIGPGPSWAEDYWRLVIARPKSLTNAAKLRMELAGRPWRQVEVSTTDQRLLLGLVGLHAFDVARKLAWTLGLQTDRGNLLTNGDFASPPKLPPFDWGLTALGNLGSSVDRDNRRLLISAIGGAKGAAAQQLLRLMPGNYQINWSFSSNMPIEPTPLSLRINCAEANVESMVPLSIPLMLGKQRRSVTITGGACHWYWFSIVADMPDAAPGLDAYLDNISMVPMAASREAPGA